MRIGGGVFFVALCASALFGGAPAARAGALFRAGAHSIDVTPADLPVIVNGGFLSRSSGEIQGRLHARWLVLDDGRTRVALGVLDTCVIPGEFADESRARASRLTGIPAARIMLSATHTHSAPSLMRCLGTDPDPAYAAFALPRVVEGLRRAVENLAPAQVGWAVASAPDLTHTRVWVRRPDKMLADPFGETSVRANMHPGYQNPDAIGPVGPSDPGLVVLAVRAPGGAPIALFASYAMHYFGAQPVSPDYFGIFAERIGPMIGAVGGARPFVGIMAQGTSGDQHWMDYARPKAETDIARYAERVARVAADAYGAIRFHDRVPLAMEEVVLQIPTRQPDDRRLAWARELVAGMAGRAPRSQPEVYAREQLWLKENPVRRVNLQALRVGELGVAMWPCEVFALSGLKVKELSPFRPTMNIALANGEEGYIPPPELYPLGGYNTWPCRTAGLAIEAETRIVEGVLALLERVSGHPRRAPAVAHGAYARAVLAARPAAYWRLEEWGGTTTARDATGAGRDAVYEPGIARWLDGPCSPAFSGEDRVNRCPHLAGGRIRADIGATGERHSVELWFWNGLANDARAVTGHLLGRGGSSLAIGGAAAHPGRLLLGGLVGGSVLEPRTWHHLALVRDGRRVVVYLDGGPRPELEGEIGAEDARELFVGGRADGQATFEGKIDEVAIYDRALAPEEIAGRIGIAGPRERWAGSPDPRPTP